MAHRGHKSALMLTYPPWGFLQDMETRKVGRPVVPGLQSCKAVVEEGLPPSECVVKRANCSQKTKKKHSISLVFP